MSPLFVDLLAGIIGRTVRVGVLGLGYVGLPLARAFALRRVSVLGFDADPHKVASLRPAKATCGRFLTPSWRPCTTRTPDGQVLTAELLRPRQMQ